MTNSELFNPNIYTFNNISRIEFTQIRYQNISISYNNNRDLFKISLFQANNSILLTLTNLTF